MFMRCRNTKSGHEASIPLGLVESGAIPDWKPIKGEEPSATPAEPTHRTTPQKSAKSDTNSNEEN